MPVSLVVTDSEPSSFLNLIARFVYCTPAGNAHHSDNNAQILQHEAPINTIRLKEFWLHLALTRIWLV
jgi:hypothetical protein